MDESVLQSRRVFLKRFGVALSASPALIAAMPWLNPLKAGVAGQSASDRVRVGVLGVGSRGQYLTRILLNTPGIEIAAVCDDYKPNYDEALSITDNRAVGVTDYRAMLDMTDLDAVVIATPLHEHARMTIDTLRAGKHVFVEKSLARSYEECWAIENAARSSGLVFQIGHQRLYSLRFLKALDLIRDDSIGEITQIRAYWHRNNDWRRSVPSPDLERKINWRMYWEYSCGLMTELASHHIQVANWFLGNPPLSVSGSGSINYWKDGREVFDNVNLVYTYPDGVHMNYDSLISNKRHGLEMQIMGPKGTLEPESGKFYLENPPPAPGIVQLINDIERGIFNSIPIGGATWVPDLAVDSKGTYLTDEPPTSDGSDLQMVAFTNAVRDARPIPGMIDQAVQAGIATLMGHHATRENSVVNWPEEPATV